MTTKPINPLLAEKQQMLAEQAERLDQEHGIDRKASAAFGRALLATLDAKSRPVGPARVTMNSAGPLVEEKIPGADPEPIGGCFSDLASEDE